MSATLPQGTRLENNQRIHGLEKKPHARLGDYVLTKTLGSGSIAKVKLAIHTPTGQKFAVKIIPRLSGNTSGTPLPPSQLARAQEKDDIKEIRHAREAALGMLLHHPHICGMREMIVHARHYYLVFEYVDGTEMLDYIISHGRLRERVARKFARQIGSALDYCHKNNVVHRDLKIENILVSQTGDIKIIDFGLGNLFNPEDHLSTICGSLYFAAPELFNGKVYTGPEVDIWSFGVVLYVLVCGKVPFDDQTVPALHAKIKRGLFDFPVWLSAECKHLISRILVTDPEQRATLLEILSHPWMVRSFGSPPDPHLMLRKPLTVAELDPAVIQEMTGFEFGTPDQIHTNLAQVLGSDRYRTAVDYWNMKRAGKFNIRLYPGTDMSMIPSIPSTSATALLEPPPRRSRLKQLIGLIRYREKTVASSPQPTALTPDGLSNTSMSEQPHPTCRFHPLLSVYYLVRERMERERVYGHRIFASSQLSVDIQRGEKGRTVDAPGTPDTESAQSVPVVESDDVSSRPQNDLIDLVTSFMTISEVVSCLTAQGCENLTNQLDLGSCSQYPISNGGFGDIYQGKLTCGTPIALKTMRMYVDTDTENRKRFKHAAKELYTWSKCQHRNVQRLLGLTEFRGQIAMVSVWEVNGNLSEYLRMREDVDRCQLSAQVAEGLAYLHGSNIVHGDLKASNVLVSKEGVPLLADFGNATLQGCTLNFTSTSTKSSISMRWAAPELLDGTEMRSAPADVYALGMTILEIITGSLPWSGRTEQAVMVAIMIKKEHPERPKDYIPDGCEHGDVLWDALTRCWVYDPKGRSGATEVRDLMQGIKREGLVQNQSRRGVPP